MTKSNVQKVSPSINDSKEAEYILLYSLNIFYVLKE